MITINIITVGSLKEKYWVQACNEYKKRLSSFAKVNFIEVKESYLHKNASQTEVLQAKKQEALDIRKKAKGFTISLEVKGKTLTSKQFANKLKQLPIQGVSEFSFIIGGSNGLDKEFSNSCNMQISFSSFTYAHQLMKVILLEQIYRAMCINNNKTYHK
jgi:23S rRNA (pseudouridine1915-N3)-methyltransferase